MFVCMHVCMCLGARLCERICMHMGVYVCPRVCLYLPVSVRNLCEYGYMHVFIRAYAVSERSCVSVPPYVCDSMFPCIRTYCIVGVCIHVWKHHLTRVSSYLHILAVLNPMSSMSLVDNHVLHMTQSLYLSDPSH